MADPVAEVLAEHQEQANDAGTIQCQCGKFETTYPSRMGAHQADALRAKGLVVSEVERGVDAAEAYIAAAIPFLPQHVSPSAEGVMALDTWQLEGGPTRDERIAWVLAALAEVYTPTGVLLWLQARNRTLGGRPIDMLTGANAEDFDRVGQVVSAMVETSAS